MKTWQKIAVTAAVIVIIAVIALFIRGNWGDLANSGVNTVFKAVTGSDADFDGFSNEDGGTDTEEVDTSWE